MSKIISYAQNFEDVLLWRVLCDVEKGFYVDVGANDPDVDSVTKLFYEKGWSGINLEPVPYWHDRLAARRPRDINLQEAAGAESGLLKIFELPDTGLSTSVAEIADRHQRDKGFSKNELDVKVNPLNNVLGRFQIDVIHFLKIDVEGTEKAVLEGLDLSKHRPWILIVESTLPNTQVEDHEVWETLITSQSYRYVYFDGLNRYYLAIEHAERASRFKAPPNVFDDFILADHWQAIKEREQLESQMTQLLAQNSKLSSFKLEVDRLSIQIEAAKVEKLEAELRFQKSVNEHLRQRAQYERQSVELQQLQRELHDSLQNAHHWWREAQAREQKLSAIEGSTFWRISGPMRMAISRYRQERNLKHAAKHFFRPAVVRSMRLVIQHPRLGKVRRLSQDFLAKQPRLRETLRRIAVNAQLVPGTPSEQVAVLQSQGQVLQLSQLPLRAQQIYHALKAANDRRAH